MNLEQILIKLSNVIIGHKIRLQQIVHYQPNLNWPLQPTELTQIMSTALRTTGWILMNLSETDH